MDTLKQDCFDGLKEKHSILSNYQNNVVMKALRVNLFDFDCNNYMVDKVREYLRLSRSLPDGHCFLYSVVKACSSQLSPNLDINVGFILDKMNSELTSCPNIYTAFTEGRDISELTTAFNDYALYKKYDTYFGDVVPLLCANALGINIITLSDSHKDCLSKVIFSKSKTKGCIFIYKRSDHYDGFIPMEHICDDPGEPLWQSGLTHDINAINNEILASDKSNDSIMLSSINDDGTEENPKDFIYRLQMHRKSNPANSLMEWFRRNSLAANPAKFQTMLLKSNSIKDIQLNVTVENISLPSSDTMKVLGIDIDDKLTFDGHISNMCIKAGRQLNVLQRLRGSLDQDSRMAIYKSFIMSNFNYCPLIWMFTSKTSLSKLENIQKRALRFVLDDYQSGYNDLLQNANVPGIKIMLLRYLAIQVFKCINEINPAYLNAMFIRQECPYALRDSSILMRPKVNLTQYGLKYFRSYGAKIWNHLPVSYKARMSLSEFKTLIKSWDGPKCKCSVCALYTWPDLLFTSFYTNVGT